MKNALIIALLCAAVGLGFKSNDVAPQAASGDGGGISGGVCPVGEFMRGITAAGVPICAEPPSAGAGVTVSATPPANPTNGKLWFSMTDLQMYIFYNDGTSSQWVPVIHHQ